MVQPDQMRIDAMQRKLTATLTSFRIGVGAIILVTALQTAVVLARIPHFGELFRDFLEGKELPAITQFFTRNHRALLVVVVLITASASAALLLSKKVWPIATGIAVILLCLLISETATFAMMQPLAQILSAMSGQ
jgi:hypothetical protein